MKDYLVSVIWISVIAAIAEILAPSLGSIKKYLKLIGALCVICIMVMPLADLLGSSEKLYDGIKEEFKSKFNKEEMNKEYEELFYEYLNDHSENELKEQIQLLLKDKFGVGDGESDIKVFILKNDNGIYPEKIQILLKGKSIFKNPYDIEGYFEDLIGCKCEVLIE